MKFPCIDITWSLAEAEAAHAGYSEIELAHFWVGVCKAVDRLRQKTQETTKKAALAINSQENQHQETNLLL